jgi:hypothetical protein
LFLYFWIWRGLLRATFCATLHAQWPKLQVLTSGTAERHYSFHTGNPNSAQLSPVYWQI